MNCEHFQESLYDYLDDTLSPSEKVAAEEHLLGCGACHEAVQSELQLARSLSTRLKQAVAAVALDANARMSIATAAHPGNAKPKHQGAVFLWPRLALGFAAAALVLLCGLWIGQQVIRDRGGHPDTPGSPVVSAREVPIHVSFSVPVYAFHKEGNLVVDSLTEDTRSMDGALLAE